MQLEELLSMKFSSEREKFAAINKLAPRDFDREYFPDLHESPEFFIRIFNPTNLPLGVKDFMARFGFYYLESEEFRKLSDGGTFIFADGIYIGVIASSRVILPGDEEFNKDSEIIIPEGKKIYYAHMYPFVFFR